MERLLMMRLQVQGCTAEVLINGIPMGRACASAGSLCLPVHEYLIEGENELTLVIEPGPPGVVRISSAPVVADGVVGATMRLLLPRIGQIGSDALARTVAEIAWAVPDGDVYDAPLAVSRSVALPLKFPRWRWLDVPVIQDVDAHRPLVSVFLQKIAADLMRGNAQALLTASRMRLEELALAYQTPVADLVLRLTSRLQMLHATKALKLVVPNAQEIVLRPCANGRLLECLGSNGVPALRTLPTPDGISSAWPARVTVLNGHCHILR